MSRVSEWRPAPRHLPAAAALLLGFLILWPWIAPIPAESRAGTGDAVAAGTTLPGLPSAASFAAIAERPLFVPSRRPAPAGAAVIDSNGVNRYRLLGLVAVGTSRRALLADGARRIEVGEGSALDRWTVKHIDQDRVLLSSPQGDAVLTLQRAGADVSSPPH
jgi:hypothetical protein